MTRSDKSDRCKVTPLRSRKEPSKQPIAPAEEWEEATYVGMKLIPWSDVWTSLTTARSRGNGQMIQVFYETLFEEAVFDDRGAWSLERRRLH
jgi:hypothetical protein